MPYVVAPPPSSGVLDRALAEANLLRVRSQYLEAERKCADVLRRHPRNRDAHNLLGDIYRDQGNQIEAQRWYKLASEIMRVGSATSSASELTSVGETSLPFTDLSQLNQTIRTDDIAHDGLGTRNLYGISPTNWMRGIWLMSVAFVAFIIVIVTYRQTTGPRLVAMPHPDGSGKTNAHYPVVLPGSNSTSGSKIDSSQVNKAPVTGTTTVSGAPRIPGSGGTDGNPGASSQAELSLLNSLSQNVELAPGGAISGVELSSSNTQVKLVIVRRIAGEIQPSQLRYAILRDAYFSARGAFMLQDGIQSAVIEVALSDGSGATQRAFHGEMERAIALQPLLDESVESLNRTFGNVQWIESLVTHDLAGNGN